ncbi:MAG TPA: hypothetical protein VMM37_04115, partial [Bacteroidota bacterium]|nr:hypothetical protein [Bacteroidota bacterium]
MKRILFVTVALLVAAIIVGYMLGQPEIWTNWNGGQVITLVALNILIGIGLSALIFALATKFLGSA